MKHYITYEIKESVLNKQSIRQQEKYNHQEARKEGCPLKYVPGASHCDLHVTGLNVHSRYEYRFVIAVKCHTTQRQKLSFVAFIKHLSCQENVHIKVIDIIKSSVCGAYKCFGLFAIF
jgi:hypothetical protein